MKIDRSLVLRIAELARIELQEAEVELYTKQLGEILKYVDQLQPVTEDQSPFSFQEFLPGHLRSDAVLPSLPPEEALKNAPERAAQERVARFFKVPRIIP